jgi:hypothetical protein
MAPSGFTAVRAVTSAAAVGTRARAVSAPLTPLPRRAGRSRRRCNVQRATSTPAQPPPLQRPRATSNGCDGNSYHDWTDHDLGETMRIGRQARARAHAPRAPHTPTHPPARPHASPHASLVCHAARTARGRMRGRAGRCMCVCCQRLSVCACGSRCGRSSSTGTGSQTRS